MNYLRFNSYLALRINKPELLSVPEPRDNIGHERLLFLIFFLLNLDQAI
jgi:hypothetical protein